MIPLWDTTASLLTAPPAALLAAGYAPGNTWAAQHFNFTWYHLTRELNNVLTAAGISQNAAIDTQLLAAIEALIVVYNTAAGMASLNPVLRAGQLGYETDTISIKIGDGVTAYNSLTYVYLGLPVSGEPSLGTPKIHSAKLWNGASPTSGKNTVDCSSAVPVGSKAVDLEFYCTTANANKYITFNDFNLSLQNFGVAFSAVAGGFVTCYGMKVPLDSLRRCAISFQEAPTAGSAVLVTIAYYC
jgi:hypothetical protein